MNVKLRACLDTPVPFCSPTKMAIFLEFQNREKTIFTGEMVAQRWGPIVAGQALIELRRADLPPGSLNRSERKRRATKGYV